MQRYLFIFLLVMLTGDGTMMLVASLHHIPFLHLLLVCISANFLSDIFFSYTGGFLLERIRFKRFLAYRAKTEKLLSSAKNPAAFLFLSKVIYGTRVLAVILIPYFKMLPRGKFLAYDFIALSIIDTIIISVSWVYGSVAARVFNDNLFQIAAVVVFLILGAHGASKWLNKWLNNRFVRLSPPSKKPPE